MVLCCVDASLVVAWLVPSQHTEAVAEVWTDLYLGADTLIAPPLLHPDTISAIRRLAFRGLLTHEEAEDLVADFLALDISTASPTGLYQRAFTLAVRYQRPDAYDACYMALAELLGCQLLTLDRKLHDSVAHNFPWIKLIA